MVPHLLLLILINNYSLHNIELLNSGIHESIIIKLISYTISLNLIVLIHTGWHDP